jgi:hypothetical protein
MEDLGNFLLAVGESFAQNAGVPPCGFPVMGDTRGSVGGILLFYPMIARGDRGAGPARRACARRNVLGTKVEIK